MNSAIENFLALYEAAPLLTTVAILVASALAGAIIGFVVREAVERIRK